MKLSTKLAVQKVRKIITDPKIFTKSVIFGDGHKIDAVYEDSLATGSSIGTVVGFHGSPGSHNDFKYIRSNLDEIGVRFIGLNYPGFSHTKGYIGQSFGNEERQMYTNAVLKKLDIAGRTVFMGHSRGCENALQTAVENNAHGLVLINPIGLRPHRAIRPQERLRKTIKIHDFLPDFLASQMVFKAYKYLGFKVKNSEECISALRTMVNVMLDGQIPHIDRLNTLKTKLLFLYAGDDHMMEPEIMFEVLEKYKGLVDLKYEDEPDIEEVSKSLRDFGKGASVFIEKDNHFQNKSRADLISKSIQTMLSE